MLENYVEEMKKQQNDFYARRVNRMLERYDTVVVDTTEMNKEAFNRKVMELAKKHGMLFDTKLKLYRHYKKIYNQI